MKTMVVKFLPTGEVQHTLKDSLFKVEGHRQIERVSEIVFDENYQWFYIRWLKGPYEGLAHTNKMLFKYITYLNSEKFVLNVILGESLGHIRQLWFKTYEDAVAHETLMLNAMRLGGEVF